MRAIAWSIVKIEVVKLTAETGLKATDAKSAAFWCHACALPDVVMDHV
jgi:hypothetical protein